jgi:serine/threonine protein kinase
MSRLGDAPTELLFGLIALHNDLVAPAVLPAALRARAEEPGRTLGDLLVASGALTGRQRELIESLSIEQIKRHGGDAAKGLAALMASPSARERLDRLGDREVSATFTAPAWLGSTVAREDGESACAIGPRDGGLRFRVLRPHAEGGLGEVFVALDVELNREVALKRMKDRHADHPAIRRRFLVEAEITGGLEHPGIVPVYGLGADADGRPYYAMRFIKGESLKEAIQRFHGDGDRAGDAAARSLAFRKLLRGFTDVCNAVDYAHDRGVLHRDIKPGNIIVGQYGETLVVDWGVAKPMGVPEAGRASSEGALIPSSASGSAETLPGIALGTPAYMSPEQAGGELDRLGPRSDVYSLGATLYALLTGRSPFEGDDVREVLGRVQRGDFAPPRAIAPGIDPALEAVCLKAMAREPADRYATSRALAEDLEWWMADEPVSAWREPLSARARRWARRHRTGATSAAAALLAGLIGLLALAAVQSRYNRELKASLQRAEAVLTFLEADVLTAARPEGQEGGLGKDVTVREAIDDAEPNIAERFKDQPLVEADIRGTLGTTYHYLGETALAIRQFKRALELRRDLLDPDHPDTLISRNNLAAAYLTAGRTAEAIALHETTLKLSESKLGTDHPDTLISRNNLALAYQAAGRTAEAIALHEAMIKLSESKHGPDHPDSIASRNNLATAYLAAGRTAEAIALHEATLKLREAKLGADHPDTLTTRNNLGAAYCDAGRTAEAIALHEATLKLSEAKRGADHPDILFSRNNLALAFQAAGRTGEAVALFEATLKLREAKLGADHPGTLVSRNNLAAAYESLDRWAEAEALRRDALARRRKITRPDSPLLAGDLAALGRNLLRQSRWSEAESLLREALAIRAKAAPDDWGRYDAMSLLGGSLLGQGRYAEAEPLIVAGYEGMKAREARIVMPGRFRLREAAERVIHLYEAWNRPDRATAWKAQLGLPDLPAEVFARP